MLGREPTSTQRATELYEYGDKQPVNRQPVPTVCLHASGELMFMDYRSERMSR